MTKRIGSIIVCPVIIVVFLRHILFCMLIITSITVGVIQRFGHQLVVIVLCYMVSLIRRGFLWLHTVSHFGFSIHFDAKISCKVAFVLNCPGIRQFHVIFCRHRGRFCGKEYRAAGFFHLLQFLFCRRIGPFYLHRIPGLNGTVTSATGTVRAGPGWSSAQQKQCQKQDQDSPCRMGYNLLFLKHFCLSPS